MPHGLLDGLRFSFTSHSEQICLFPTGDYFEAILTLWTSLQTDCTMHLKACRCQAKTVCCVSESYKSHLNQSVSSTGIRVNSYYAVFDISGMRSCCSLQRAAWNVEGFHCRSEDHTPAVDLWSMFPQGWRFFNVRPQGHRQTLQCRRSKQPRDCHQLTDSTLPSSVWSN